MEVASSLVPTFDDRLKIQNNQAKQSLREHGISVFVSDSYVGKDLNDLQDGPASVNTRLSEDTCKILHTALKSLVAYSTKKRKRWNSLPVVKRQAMLRGLNVPECNPEYGWLHNLVSKEDQLAPKGYTLNFVEDPQDKLFSAGSTTWTVTAHLIPISPRLSTRMWKTHSLRISILQEASNSSTKARWTLRIQGSALEVMQGQANYVVPSDLPDLVVDDPDGLHSYESALLEHSIRYPFVYVAKLLRLVVQQNIPLIKTLAYNLPRSKLYDLAPGVARRLAKLPEDVIYINNLTLTQYVPEKYIKSQGVDTQHFLHSLRTVFSVAKSNYEFFMDEGVKSYNGTTTETALVDEDLRQDPVAKVRTVKDVYSVRLTHNVTTTQVKNRFVSAKSVSSMTSVQFSLTKTRGLGQLGMSKEAKSALESCLRIRYTMHYKHLRDNRVETLQDLKHHLRVDYGSLSFRARVRELLSMTLAKTDYVYWWYNRHRWSSYLSKDARAALRQALSESGAPERIQEVMRLWMNPNEWIKTELSLVKPAYLVMKVCYPKEYSKLMFEGERSNPELLRKCLSLSHTVRQQILDRYGLDILYPFYFHQTMYKAIQTSLLSLSESDSPPGGYSQPLTKAGVTKLSRADSYTALAFGLKPALKKLHIL